MTPWEGRTGTVKLLGLHAVVTLDAVDRVTLAMKAAGVSEQSHDETFRKDELEVIS